MHIEREQVVAEAVRNLLGFSCEVSPTSRETKGWETEERESPSRDRLDELHP